MENKLFQPTKFLYNNHSSEQLRVELNNYDLDELKKIYKSISYYTLPRKTLKNKNTMIETIVEKSLNICNRGWIFNPQGKTEAPYK